MHILTTKRLSLRTLELDDAAFYLQLVNDPSWITNIGDKGIRSIAAAQDAILKNHIAIEQTMGFSLYVVERSSDQTALGLCGLVKRERFDDLDLGYALLPAYHGQGYAFEAASGVLTYAKNSLGLPRLLGITSLGNIISSRLLEKLGFTFQSILLWKEDDEVRLYQRDL
ncbi:GNAT family N-acetyltransferase [soil metagenome]